MGSTLRRDGIGGASRWGGGLLLIVTLQVAVGCASGDRFARFDERLHEAIWEEDEVAIARLLEREPELVHSYSLADAGTPLHWAVRRGRWDLVARLLDAGAEVDAVDGYLGRTPLFVAVRQGSRACVDVLLARGASIDSGDGERPSVILEAARLGRSDLLDVLLEHRPELDILEASAVGDDATVVRLLRGDPDLVHAQSETGERALHLASSFGHEHIARRLLEAGAGLHASDESGETPLHHAASAGRPRVSEFLCELGAEVDRHNLLRCTPLHLAALAGHDAVAEVLIRHGASIRAEDLYGRTPLDWAERHGHAAIARRLESAEGQLATRPMP